MSITTYPGLQPHQSKHVESLYNTVRDSSYVMDDGKLSTGELVQLSSRLVLLSEPIQGLVGANRQALVLAVLNKVVQLLPMDESDRKIANMLITHVLPPAIEFAVRASKGEFNIGGKWKTVKIWCARNCGCGCTTDADTPLVKKPLNITPVSITPTIVNVNALPPPALSPPSDDDTEEEPVVESVVESVVPLDDGLTELHRELGLPSPSKSHKKRNRRKKVKKTIIPPVVIKDDTDDGSTSLNASPDRQSPALCRSPRITPAMNW